MSSKANINLDKAIYGVDGYQTGPTKVKLATEILSSASNPVSLSNAAVSGCSSCGCSSFANAFKKKIEFFNMTDSPENPIYTDTSGTIRP